MKDISELRSAINAIDDQIIDLFNRRASIVKNVGIFKKQNLKSGTCFIRSGREAEVVRRVYEQFRKGIFPAKAAADMWRLVICASLLLETELSVSVHESDVSMYWLAREYFGRFTPMIRQKEAEVVIRNIIDGEAQVGVFPVTGEGWWLHLPEDIKVFACVPYVLQSADDKVHALAAARLEPEETGDDISLLKLEADDEIDQNLIHEVFRKHSVDAKLLSTIGNFAFMEAQGFITSRDKRLLGICKETGFAISILGAYAVPLKA